MEQTAKAEDCRIVGHRIKTLRVREGLSRADVARRIGVDVTAVAGWETGKYWPRQRHRASLARLLGTDLAALFSNQKDAFAPPVLAILVDTLTELPGVLDELLARTQRCVRAMHFASPHATAAYAQQKFRSDISARLLNRTLEVQRVEIFYNLDRLKDVLSNILRYDGCHYHVNSYCAGQREIPPVMGGYFFDNSEFVIGNYWLNVPPHGRLSMRLSGEPFQTFFLRFWDEIWQRGTLLNLRGAHDLSSVKELACQMGLKPRQWPQFLEEASALKVGDGAPPHV